MNHSHFTVEMWNRLNKLHGKFSYLLLQFFLGSHHSTYGAIVQSCVFADCALVIVVLPQWNNPLRKCNKDVIQTGRRWCSFGPSLCTVSNLMKIRASGKRRGQMD